MSAAKGSDRSVCNLTRQSAVAIVTRGARGIGRVTARLLAESGADVAVVDLAEAPRRWPTYVAQDGAAWQWSPTFRTPTRPTRQGGPSPRISAIQ